MNDDIKTLSATWSKRNITNVYTPTKEEALRKVLELVPGDATIGFSGSMTLHEVGVIEALKKRGNVVYDPYAAGLSKEESLAVRSKGVTADVYLASPNAISAHGELVFLSAFGNRTAGIAHAKNVILVAGTNKIVRNVDEALKRAREYVAPLNCKRLNWQAPCYADGICREAICLFPEYKRMCCQALIIEAEITPERLQLILVGEKLGF